MVSRNTAPMNSPSTSEMANKEEVEASREGLLRSESPIPLRPRSSSLDRAYRSSSESREEPDDLDLREQLRPQKNKRGRWPWSQNRAPRYLSVNNHDAGGQKASLAWKNTRTGRIKNCLWRWRTCLLVTVILLGGLIGLLAGGGFWVYKTTPLDGVSFQCFFALLG